MKIKIIRFLSIISLCAIISSCALKNREIVRNTPIKVILDTDMGQDCDDAAAMALLHQFADHGEAEILAVMFPMQDPMGAPAIDVINTYYGRPNIPIGTYKGNVPYIGKLFDHYNTKLAKAFPHDLKHGDEAPDAVKLYRKTLAQQPNHSVVVITVGPQRLLADLLNSEPDEFSSLSGRDLVKKKVKLLSLMGAHYPKGFEWNIRIAPDAAKLVAETWPTPIVYSGYEIGEAIRTGNQLIAQGDVKSPIWASYEKHPFVHKKTNDRQSWDQTAVLYAVRGAQSFWTVADKGYFAFDEKGNSAWREDVDKNHSYLVLNKPAAEVAAVIEDLMMAKPALNKSN